LKLATAALLGLISTTVSLSSPSAASAETTATKKSEKPKAAPSVAQIHYATRVQSFREQNYVFANVVLLGDSITEGFDVAKYFPGRRVINRGIGSDVIGNNLPDDDKRGVTRRLNESVFDCAPTQLFIMIGINDLAQGHTPEIVEAGYREMVTKIRERLPLLPIHLQSVLPTRGKLTNLNPNIVDTNARIQKLAAEFHCDYIDLHSKMKDGNGELREEITRDGVHLTEPAYKIWKDIILDKLQW